MCWSCSFASISNEDYCLILEPTKTLLPLRWVSRYNLQSAVYEKIPEDNNFIFVFIVEQRRIYLFSLSITVRGTLRMLLRNRKFYVKNII